VNRDGQPASGSLHAGSIGQLLEAGGTARAVRRGGAVRCPRQVKVQHLIQVRRVDDGAIGDQGRQGLRQIPHRDAPSRDPAGGHHRDAATLAVRGYDSYLLRRGPGQPTLLRRPRGAAVSVDARRRRSQSSAIRQGEFGVQPWFRDARELGLNESQYRNCIDGASADQVVRADIAEGVRLGVKSTPTFFVGQRQKDGMVQLRFRINGAHPLSVFDEVIGLMLKGTDRG
jgi:hypothetical protein